MTGTHRFLLQLYAMASSVAHEAIAGIRTVVANSAQSHVENIFGKTLEKDNSSVLRIALAIGFGQVSLPNHCRLVFTEICFLEMQGFSVFATFFLYFCGFAGGSFLMQHNDYSFKDVLQEIKRPYFSIITL